MKQKDSADGMKHFLIGYLAVTGLASAVLVVVPALVLVAGMALIIPGLVLGAIPTAFLYGLVFSIFWFPLQRLLGDTTATIAAGIATAALLWLLPVPGNAVTTARYQAQFTTDVIPDEKIALRGHIRLDTLYPPASTAKQPEARGGRHAAVKTPDFYVKSRLCSDLCVALLFMDAVESVTVNQSRVDTPELSTDAVTFTRRERSQCSAKDSPPPAEVEPSYGVDGGFAGFPSGIRSELTKAWKLRLATRDCIVASPPPAGMEHDFRLVASRFTRPFPNASSFVPWFGGKPVHVERLEVFDKTGAARMRKTAARAARLIQPILYLPEGDMQNFHFAWASKPVGPRYAPPLEHVPLLTQYSDLRLEENMTGFEDAVRQRLSEVVASPSIRAGDPAFSLVHVFFDSFERRTVAADDIDLTIKLIADPRVLDFGGIWRLTKAMGQDRVRLREPIVARLLTADAVRERSLRTLSDTLREMPPGTFRTLRDSESAVLNDVERSTIAEALIERQADRGAAASRLLVDIIRTHLKLQAGPASRGRQVEHHRAFQAAMVALTRIGPDAGPGILADLEGLRKEGLVFDGLYRSEAWSFMLARLGKPVDQLPTPSGVVTTPEQFQRKMRRELADYDKKKGSA